MSLRFHAALLIYDLDCDGCTSETLRTSGALRIAIVTVYR